MIIESLAKNWGWIAFRGVAAIVFGLLTFFAPGITLVVLVLLFGCYALVDGIFNLIVAFRRHGAERRWWALLLEALVSIAAGLITLFLPGITALGLVWVIAAWALVTGVFEIVAAIRLRKEITGEWLLVLSGILSIIFGALLFIAPGPGALALVLWIGAYSIVFGVMLLALAIKLRAMTSHGQPRPAAAGGVASS